MTSPSLPHFAALSLLPRLAAISLAVSAIVVPVEAQVGVRPLQRSAPVSPLALTLASTAPFASSAPSAATSAVRLRARHEYLSQVAERDQDEIFVDTRLFAYGSPARDFQGGGRARIQRLGWDAEIGRRVGERTSFTVGLRAEGSFYDLTAAPDLGLAGAKPFNDVYETGVSTTLTAEIGPRTTFFTGVDWIVSGEDEASIGDASTFGIVTGARQRSSDDVAVVLGVDVRTRLEDDPWIIPYLGLDWSLDENWSVHVAGTSARVERRLGREWTLFAVGRYELRQYRLNDDAPISRGVVRDEQIEAGWGLTWRPRPGVAFTGSAGTTLWQELSTYDRDGDKLGEDELGTGAWLALEMKLAF